MKGKCCKENVIRTCLSILIASWLFTLLMSFPTPFLGYSLYKIYTLMGIPFGIFVTMFLDLMKADKRGKNHENNGNKNDNKGNNPKV